MSGRERRKYRRVPSKDVAGHVRVKDQVLAMGLPIDNISMGGLFVRCTNPLPRGTPVLLELVRPYSDPLKLVGTVVVSVDAVSGMASGAVPGMGVQFDTLATETAKKLSSLLMTLLAVPEEESPAAATPAPASEGTAPGANGREPKRSSLAAPAHNPANVDDAVVGARAFFDFSFASLDPLHQEAPRAAFNVPSAAAPTEAAPAPARNAPRAAPSGSHPAPQRRSSPGLAARPTSALSEAEDSARPDPASAERDTNGTAHVGAASDTAARASGHPKNSTSADSTSTTRPGAASQAAARANPATIPTNADPDSANARLSSTAWARAGAHAHEESSPSMPPAQPIPVADNAKLLVQVRGLLEDLGETQAELARRARENDELRDRLHAAFEELMRRDERIRELEHRLELIGRA